MSKEEGEYISSLISVVKTSIREFNKQKGLSFLSAHHYKVAYSDYIINTKYREHKNKIYNGTAYYNIQTVHIPISRKMFSSDFKTTIFTTVYTPS